MSLTPTATDKAWSEGFRAGIEAAAMVAKIAWLTFPYGEIADADAMCALSEHAESAIHALAVFDVSEHSPPKPSGQANLTTRASD